MVVFGRGSVVEENLKARESGVSEAQEGARGD